MVIYDSLGNKILDTPVLDRSGLYRSIDNTEEFTLYFSLDSYVEIPVGSYCTFEGNRYEVMSDDNVRMNHTKSYDYTVVFSSDYTLASRFMVLHTVDRRIKFDMVATPAEHLKMIVDNLNQREHGWTIGECIEAEPKLVSYNHTKCHLALKMIAEIFETELEVIGKSISLKKVEYYKDSPLALAYGKGNGFRPGIQRVNVKDGLPVERLFIQGGTKNISLKEYGASELHLPKALSFKFDGSLFEWEDGFNKEIAKDFITNNDGSVVELKSLWIVNEDSLDLSEIYPKREGSVSTVLFLLDGKEYKEPKSSWTEEEWNRVQVDIIDDSIPASLDYKECLIGGESLTVIFQSGMLAGRELQANYIASSKRFELVKQEIDGQPMPQNSFVPVIGDTYAVFNVSLPAAYVSDPTTHSGAEYDALREASIYLYENCVKKFTFTGEIDDIWSKKNWLSVGPRIRLGSYISFSHESMFPDAPAVVRIVGITQYVNNPYAPKIEISNAVGSTSVSSRINKIENREAHVTELYEDAKRYAKRRFTDVQQTIKMLEAAIGGFTEGINPITVETMLMLVGDNSLQYLFTASLSSDNTVVPSFDFDSDAGTFSVSAAYIKHMTLGIDSISPMHSDDEYLRWALPAFTSGVLESDKGYYLYAKVAKDSQTGVFLLSESALDLNADEGYYNLLVGILNSQNDEGRSFAPMYGFTEILPGQITTDNIRSSDGKTWLDLVKGILHLNDMAGVSGVKDTTKGDKSIAAWFGGLMQDKELDSGATNPARSVIRHDGTGYFADGLFSWDKEYGINIGNDQLKINYDGSVDFGGKIRIGSTGEETLDSLLTIVAGLTDMWYLDNDGNVRTKHNVVIEGDTSSGGEGQDTPSAGLNEEQLQAYLDEHKYVTEDDVAGLIPDVDLSDYYTSAQTDSAISTAIANLVNGAPTTLDTLKEIADALAENEDVVTALEAAIGTKASASDLTALTTRVSTAETNITNLTNNKADKATTLAGYGITNAYTKTEIDTKVSTLNTTISGVSGRVTTLETWKSDIAKYITIEDGNVKISTNLIVTGDTSSGGSGEDTGAEGTVTGVKVGTSTYEDVTAGLLDLTSLFSGYTTTGVHSSLATRVTALEGKATAVSFSQALTSGTAIGTITIDGTSKVLYTPTIPTSLKNPTALSWSGYSSGSYDGSAAKSITIPNNTNQLTNGAGFITASALPKIYTLAINDSSGATLVHYDPEEENKSLTLTKAAVGLGNVTNLAASGYLTALSSNTTNAVSITVGGTTKNITQSALRTALGLGSNAYTSTAYLPLTGGTISGRLNVTNINGYTPITSGNIGSQSVNYATSAGNANTVGGYSASSLISGYLFRELPFSVPSAGWYKIASYATTNYYPRRETIFQFYGTDGTTVPFSLTVRCAMSWSFNESNIVVEGYNPYGIKIRFSKDSSNTYIEAYFNQSISACYLRVPYAAYSTGISNQEWTWTGSGALTQVSPTSQSNEVGALSGISSSYGFNGKATSATKLATARTIWGQSFDGTGNVTGALSGVTNINSALYINSSGNVTIGSSDLAGTGSITPKLYVNGNIRLAGAIYFSDNSYINYTNTYLPSNDGSNSHQICSSSAILAAFYSDGRTYIRGNVGIGTTSPAYKLDVAGTGRFTGAVTMSSNLTVSGTLYGSNNLFMGTGAEGIYITNNTMSWHDANNAFASGIFAFSTSNVKSLKDILPNTSDTYSLGSSSYRWSTIYGTAGNYGNATNHVLLNPTNVTINTTTTGGWSRYLAITNSGTTMLLYGAYGTGSVLSYGYIGTGYSSPWVMFTSAAMTVNGDAIITGDTSSGSDIRFKDVIKDKTLKIEDIAKAPLFTFKWNDRDDDTVHLGSSAQYWENVAPWLVTGEDFKTLNYATLGVAMGISLAKELLKEVNRNDRQDMEIRALKRNVKDLENKIRMTNGHLC